MDSWENIALQWINCLYDLNDSIKTIEELQDGKIYYNLINRIIPWGSKKSNKNQRYMVLEFLKDEYPNFPFKNENSAIGKLCIATLVLSRLSLEPIFHKMLCTNLDVDIQIKIKSILETVYSLDKSITEEDLYNIFLISSKKNLKLFDTKTKFVLDEFIETSESTIDHEIQLEQTKQIRQLKVQIESMGYENSDLEADIADQKRQIKDLQNKLQEVLSELKTVQADNFKLNSTFMVPKNKKDVESICQKEENLEKYLNKLQLDNHNNKLQEQNKALAVEVKQLYREKYQELKEKNENKKKLIELVMLNKTRESQIKVLQNKLQEALWASSLQNNNSIEALKTTCFNEMKGLEKSVIKLKSKNYQLEQEKQALIIDKLKLYKQRHYILKEKN